MLFIAEKEREYHLFQMISLNIEETGLENVDELPEIFRLLGAKSGLS